MAARPITTDSFAPFGVVPPDEGDGAPTADIEFANADGWVNYISHSIDEIVVVDGALRCELLNRHDTHTQTLMPVSGDALMVVAPAEIDFERASHLETVRAFLLPQYSCVHLRRGTWHWGPFPLRADSVRVFNIQSRGYPDDNATVWLARDHGIAYDVTA